MTVPQVSAILVNYNAGRELAMALQSIADDLAEPSWEAVVVDNASSDGSAAAVTAFAPHARVIQNRENVGFARGVNQGLGATSAPTVLIMNPDCRLGQGAFGALSGELESGDRVALAGPRILNPDGSVQGSARGDPDMLTGLFGRTTALRRALPNLGVSKRNVIAADAARRRQHRGRLGLRRVHAGAPQRAGAGQRIRRALFSVLGRRRPVPAAARPGLPDPLRAGGDRRFTVSAIPAAIVRSSAIRAFHESAYLYYSTHVAPTASPKRLAAKVLLAARCWLKLQQSRPSLK